MKDVDDYFIGFIAMIIFGLVVYTIISIEINAREQMMQIIDNRNECLAKMEADRVWLHERVKEYSREAAK